MTLHQQRPLPDILQPTNEVSRLIDRAVAQTGETPVSNLGSQLKCALDLMRRNCHLDARAADEGQQLASALAWGFAGGQPDSVLALCLAANQGLNNLVNSLFDRALARYAQQPDAYDAVLGPLLSR